MGQEKLCTMRVGGNTYKGKALLESNEILFRGETRLKIPFASITEITAKDGALHVRTAEGLAVFQLGPAAEKWRERILHPKSVLDKLGVKPGELVVLHGTFDSSFLADLKKLGAVQAKGKSARPCSSVFLAAREKGELAKVKSIANSLQGAASLWIVYPKGQKTITEIDVITAGRKTGLKDVKVVSFSPTHTALKFVIPVNAR